MKLEHDRAVSDTPGVMRFKFDGFTSVMACHRTQCSDEVIERPFPPMARAWTVNLIAAFSDEPGVDLFQ